jgi:hypothetical protein
MYLISLKPEEKLISRREKCTSSILSVKYSLELRKSNEHHCEFLYMWYTFHHKKEVAIWGTFLKHQSNSCGRNVLPSSFLRFYMDLTKLYHMCSYLEVAEDTQWSFLTELRSCLWLHFLACYTEITLVCVTFQSAWCYLKFILEFYTW